MVIYIHIPFCIKKCDYCDFLSAACDEKTREKYVACLINEIRLQGQCYGIQGRNIPVTSVFFGGGTPSILTGEQLSAVMSQLRNSFSIEDDAEITMECNPGTLTEEKLSYYKGAGVNRLSIGLQSADDNELKSIGRIHTFEQFRVSYDMIKKYGFNNINVDLMSALPGQTIESYKATIEKILELKPQHISAYSLILEEGTPLYDRITALERSGLPTGLPDEDTEREMYYMTGDMLAAAGYNRYEISNYALDGYQCRHNTAYWLRDNYLGIGIGAASCMDNVRTKNICDIKGYMDMLDMVCISEDADCDNMEYRYMNVLDEDETQVLDKKDIMEEFMFLGLRMMKGIQKSEFERQFGVEFNQVYGNVVDKLIKEGLLDVDIDNDRLWLTPLGIDVSNMVLAQFIVD